MKPPQILGIIPLYNAHPYSKKAIESFLSQTFTDFSLLIINDGSTDGCDQEAALIKDDRIILWDQKNQGPGAAMNRALKYALDQNIPYIARMDADDISLPNRLEKQMQLMKKFPDTAACSSNCYYIDVDTEQIIGSSTVSVSPRLIQWEINHGLRGLIQSSTIFQTRALSSIGGYRPQFVLAEEADVFLRLARKFELRNCDDYLCKIRIRPNSLSMKNIQKNILYQFYALDCARKEQKKQAENDFDHFYNSMSWYMKCLVWREEYLLKLWRSYIDKRSYWALLLAAFIDPRRVFLRVARKIF